MIKIVEDSLLNATETFILHQVNCQGVMGTGVALQIKQKYPHVFEKYYNLCKNYPTPLLGGIQIIPISKEQSIVNVFGQDRYGRDKRYTDYKALERALIRLANMTQGTIALPYNMGCNNAGGDWSIVYSIIEKAFAKHNVTIYKFGGYK